MWLHRKKGVVSGGTQVSSFTNLVNGWAAGTGTGNVTYLGEMLNSYTLKINSPFAQFFLLELQRTSTTAYDVSIARDGIEVLSVTNITSTFKSINLNSYIQVGSTYTLTLTYATAVTFTDIEWTLANPPFSQNQFFSTGSYTAPANFEFVISEQIPEIKVIDFLTGLFKMFNLTTFVEDDGTIFVDTLDDF
jgi:hypothetical protein